MHSDSSQRQWLERRLLDLECNFRMINDRITTFKNRLQGFEQHFQNMQSRMDALEDKLHSIEPHAENVHCLNNWAAALENKLNMSQEFSRILGTLHNQIALTQLCSMQNLEKSLQRLVLDQNTIQEEHQTLRDRMCDQNLKTQRLENLLRVEAL